MAKRGKLTPKMLRFCEEYAVDFNASAAARRAGYSERSAAVQGAKMLRKGNIQAEILKLRKDTSQALNITKESLLQILRDIAGADLRKITDPETGAILPVHAWPEDMTRVAAGVEADELYEGRGDDRQAIGTRLKVKLSERTKAIELLSRMLGFNMPDKVAPVDPEGNPLPIINVITAMPKPSDNV